MCSHHQHRPEYSRLGASQSILSSPTGSNQYNQEGCCRAEKRKPSSLCRRPSLSDGEITKTKSQAEVSFIESDRRQELVGTKVSSWQRLPYGSRLCTDCFSVGIITNSRAFPEITGYGGDGQGFRRDSVSAHWFFILTDVEYSLFFFLLVCSQMSLWDRE